MITTGKPGRRPDVDICMTELTMFTTSWCGYCRRLKLRLTEAGIAYREVDIERDPEAAAFVERVNGGNQTVPTLLYPDGSTATNPSLDEVKAALAAA
jgi:mycoredoxin